MRTLLFLGCLLGILSNGFGLFRSCPRIRGVQNFSPKKFAGVWFEFARNRHWFSFWHGHECVRTAYTNKGDRMGFLREGRDHWGHLNSRTGIARIVRERRSQNPNFCGDLRVAREPLLKHLHHQRPNERIIATDYKNYAIIYNCKHGNLWPRTEFVRVLTRKANPSPKLRSFIFRKINRFGLKTDQLRRTDQSRCSPPLQHPKSFEYSKKIARIA